MFKHSLNKNPFSGRDIKFMTISVGHSTDLLHLCQQSKSVEGFHVKHPLNWPHSKTGLETLVGEAVQASSTLVLPLAFILPPLLSFQFFISKP